MIVVPGLVGRAVPVARIPVPLLSTVLVATVVFTSCPLISVILPFLVWALVPDIRHLDVCDEEAASPRDFVNHGRRGSCGVPVDCAAKGAVACLQPAVCHS